MQLTSLIRCAVASNPERVATEFEGRKRSWREFNERVSRLAGATLINGKVKTGDAAYMDDDGFVFIVDRLKDMIVSGGENIFCAEVESAVSTYPGVAEVAVFGVPSDEWGEAIHAVVVPEGCAKLTDQEIIDHCRSRIAHYKCPRSFEFREKPLPLSGAGKVLKRELRAPFWAGKSRGVN